MVLRDGLEEITTEIEGERIGEYTQVDIPGLFLRDKFTGKQMEVQHYNEFLKKWNRSKESWGHGGYGQVYKCEPKPEFKNDPDIYRQTNQTLLGYLSYTLRKIPRPGAKDIRGTLIGNEIMVMDYFKHPHLIEKVKIYKNEKNFYVVQEHRTGGHLLGQVKQNLQKFSEVKTCLIAIQLVCAIKHLHEQNVVHRDLKTQNILLERPINYYGDSHVVCKVSDHGLATIIQPNETKNHVFCGQDEYIAPEIIAQIREHQKNDGQLRETIHKRFQVQYSSKVDVWSVGIITYELFTGHPPFQGKTKDEIWDKISAGRVDYTSCPKLRNNELAQSFIKSCLMMDPNERQNATKLLLSHPWIIQMNEKILQQTMIDDVWKDDLITYLVQLKEDMEGYHFFQKALRSSKMCPNGKGVIDKNNFPQFMDHVKEGLIKLPQPLNPCVEELMAQLLYMYDHRSEGMKLDVQEFIDRQGHNLIQSSGERLVDIVKHLDMGGNIGLQKYLLDSLRFKTSHEQKQWKSICKVIKPNKNGSVTIQQILTNILVELSKGFLAKNTFTGYVQEGQAPYQTLIKASIDLDPKFWKGLNDYSLLYTDQ